MINLKLQRTSYPPIFIYGLLLVAALFLASCGTVQQNAPIQPTPEKSVLIIDPKKIPETPREMRAAWIATVDNIDWPSKPGLPADLQKAELRALLDRAVQLNFNAVILQVRPAADAFYDSPYEPWSEFLTGKQGQPPQPYYDPLSFAIEEAHLRGLELHAWFNPFRAYHFSAKGAFADNHIKNQHPHLVLKYGRYWWLDPGQPKAREHSLKVILDVARRYDIDGIHLDDYFYPYAELNANNKEIPFPDTASYRRFIKENDFIEKADWRRQNIDGFVEKLHKEIKKVKPYLRFGISPFGIWRPGYPPQIEGYDAYNEIYADARKWFNKGWVDYLSPQLYWPIDNPPQSFPVLLEWWQQQNTFNRHLWPGLYTGRAGNSWQPDEIGRQIQLTRKQTGAAGNIHFSMKALMNNSGNISAYLLTHEYAHPALVPATYWLSKELPSQPDAHLKKHDDQWQVTLNANPDKEPWLWVLKTKYGDNWMITILPGRVQSHTLSLTNDNGSFAGIVVSTIDRLGVESTPQMLLPFAE